MVLKVKILVEQNTHLDQFPKVSRQEKPEEMFLIAIRSFFPQNKFFEELASELTNKSLTSN